MKNIYKRSSKIRLALACAFCIMAMLACITGTAIFACEGVYGSHPHGIENELMRKAGYECALRAVAEYHGGEIITECDTSLEGTGFKYGIIDGRLDRNPDFNAEGVFEEKNFTGKLPEDYGYFQFRLGENAEYYFSDRLLAGSDYYADWESEQGEDGGTTLYTVVYFTEGAPDMTGGYFHGNLYAQAAALAAMVPTLRVAMPIGAALLLGLAAWTMYLLFCAAGHRYGEEDIFCGLWERIPMDLTVVIVGFLETMLAVIMVSAADSMRRPYEYLVWILALTALLTFAGCLLGIRWLMSVAVNVKKGKWWRNTVVYRILKLIANCLAAFRSSSRAIRKSIRWDIRIWVLFGVITFLEGFGLAVFDADGGLVVVWVFEKILFGAALFFIMKWYGRLKEAAVRMAEDGSEIHIDTKGMPLDFEEHAEALNAISGGMAVAMAERMKSERMKTELITNVSHDIKTPLTSIINYVDLLEKENIEGEKANEYLEVLDRQSKHLKKLIEDLIEASKAATGNIKFHMESVNARVLLNQSIGEFEERLLQNGIELVTNMPEEEVHLWADNRYLWRVFDNLMNNIAKYAQPGTRAYVDLTEAEGKVRFVFRNISRNALNISADELMERFVRGDASRNTEGNGLGLSIARSLTESMDGSMNLSIDGDLFKVILTFEQTGAK